MTFDTGVTEYSDPPENPGTIPDFTENIAPPSKCASPDTKGRSLLIFRAFLNT